MFCTGIIITFLCNKKYIKKTKHSFIILKQLKKYKNIK